MVAACLVVGVAAFGVQAAWMSDSGRWQHAHGHRDQQQGDNTRQSHDCIPPTDRAARKERVGSGESMIMTAMGRLWPEWVESGHYVAINPFGVLIGVEVVP
jgi:hypothetical protein